DCRPAGSEIPGNFIDRVGAAAQQAENFPPRRVGDGAEHSFTPFGASRNHRVTLTVTGWLPRVKRITGRFHRKRAENPAALSEFHQVHAPTASAKPAAIGTMPNRFNVTASYCCI